MAVYSTPACPRSHCSQNYLEENWYNRVLLDGFCVSELWFGICIRAFLFGYYDTLYVVVFECSGFLVQWL